MEPGIWAKADANVSSLVPFVLAEKSIGHHREELLFFLRIMFLFLLWLFHSAQILDGVHGGADIEI
ncbi:MAG: hypothetical protein WBW01_09715 [Terriglobales bacterium]